MTALPPLSAARRRARRVGGPAKKLTVERVEGAAVLLRAAIEDIDNALNMIAAAHSYRGSEYAHQAQDVDWIREEIEPARRDLVYSAGKLELAGMKMRTLRERRRGESA